MSMNDPIADFLTRIRNAGMARHESVSIPFSKIKESICELLKKQRLIAGFETTEIDATKKSLLVQLKYYKEQPVVRKITRISKPGLRKYCNYKEMPRSIGGIGFFIISTSKGLMTDAEARTNKLGGEIIFEII